jgi:hypothetical protein
MPILEVNAGEGYSSEVVYNTKGDLSKLKLARRFQVTVAPLAMRWTYARDLAQSEVCLEMKLRLSVLPRWERVEDLMLYHVGCT